MVKEFQINKNILSLLLTVILEALAACAVELFFPVNIYILAATVLLLGVFPVWIICKKIGNVRALPVAVLLGLSIGVLLILWFSSSVLLFNSALAFVSAYGVGLVYVIAALLHRNGLIKNDSGRIVLVLVLLAVSAAPSIVLFHHYTNNANFFSLSDIVLHGALLAYVSFTIALYLIKWLPLSLTVINIILFWAVFWLASWFAKSINNVYPTIVFWGMVCLGVCFAVYLIFSFLKDGTKFKKILSVILLVLWILLFSFQSYFYIPLFCLLAICVIIGIEYVLKRTMSQNVTITICCVVCLMFAYNAINGVIYSHRLNDNKSVEELKTDFIVNDNCEHPDIYWLHMDGMISFDTIETFFTDSQMQLKKV